MSELSSAERRDFTRALDYAEGEIDGFFSAADAEVRVDDLPAGGTFPTEQVQGWGNTITLSWGFWQWRSGRSAWHGYPLSDLPIWLGRLERAYIEMARVKAGIDRAPGLARAVERAGGESGRAEAVDNRGAKTGAGQAALPLPIHAGHPRVARYVAAIRRIREKHDPDGSLASPSAVADYERELEACTRRHFPGRYVFDPFGTNLELNEEVARRAMAALAGGVKAIDDVARFPDLSADGGESDPRRIELIVRTRECTSALREIRRRFHPGTGIADIADGPPQYAAEVEACLAGYFPPRVTAEGLLGEVSRYRDRARALVRGNVTADDVEEMTHRANHALFWMHYLGVLPTFEPVKWGDPPNIARQFEQFVEMLKEFGSDPYDPEAAAPEGRI